MYPKSFTFHNYTVIYPVICDSFRMTELWDYPKYGCPFKRGDMYYYFYNSGLQNQRYSVINSDQMRAINVILIKDAEQSALRTHTLESQRRLYKNLVL